MVKIEINLVNKIL